MPLQPKAVLCQSKRSISVADMDRIRGNGTLTCSIAAYPNSVRVTDVESGWTSREVLASVADFIQEREDSRSLFLERYMMSQSLPETSQLRCTRVTCLLTCWAYWQVVRRAQMYV